MTRETTPKMHVCFSYHYLIRLFEFPNNRIFYFIGILFLEVEAFTSQSNSSKANKSSSVVDQEVAKRTTVWFSSYFSQKLTPSLPCQEARVSLSTMTNCWLVGESKKVRWRSGANLLYSNWLNYFVYQTTPYDINEIQ